MRYNISLLIFALCVAHITNGMSLPLGKIEKKIFLKHVKEIGKKAALRQIKKTKNPKMFFDKGRIIKKDWCRLETYPCFTITTFIDPENEDALSKSVINAVETKEVKDGYIPEHIEEKVKNGICVTMPNNFLENYTRYWHGTDQHKGPYDSEYIKLVSTFTDKQALLDVLNKE